MREREKRRVCVLAKKEEGDNREKKKKSLTVDMVPYRWRPVAVDDRRL